MSSRTIERDVVEMDFDPAEFRAGVQETLKYVNLLKSSLNFQSAVENFAEISASSRKVDLSHLGSAVDGISNKLSGMGIIAATVLNRITNAALDVAKNLFRQNILEPITLGLQEYEVQMGSIQTILANTSSKGIQLPDVQKALNELNLYADKTIYNFTQMTQSIGKFTAAGVELDTSVAAIKGIANLAAVSGSDANQASNAMYQLSQAIATGVVKLQDWNSVVNAGMGGEVFQNALLETARVHGIAVDKMIEQEGGFRGTLQRGWLSSEILLETLSKFTGDLTEQQLEAMGYTEEQITEIIKLGEMANAAATDIKTLTQLKDTMMESLQSGWSETWRLILGDFEEAKELFGAIGDFFGGIISASAEARNSQIGFWAGMGGRDLAIKGFMSAMESIVHITGLFKEALRDVFPPVRAGELYSLTKWVVELIEKFKMGEESSENFKAILRGVFSVIDILKMAILAILKPIGTLFKSLNPAGEGLLEFAVRAGKYLYALRNALKSTDLFGKVVNLVIVYIKAGIRYLSDLVDQFMRLEAIQDIVGYFQSLTREDLVGFFDKVRNVLFSVLKVVGALGYGVYWLFEQFMALEPVQKVLKYLQDLTWDDFKAFIQLLADQIPIIQAKFEAFKQAVRDTVKRVTEFVDKVKNLDVVQDVLEYFQRFDGSRIRKFFGGIRLDFSFIGDIFNGMRKGASWLTSILEVILPILKNIAKAAGDALSNLVEYLTDKAGSTDWVGLIKVINTALVTALLVGLNSLVRGGWLGDVFDKLFAANEGIGSSITGAFGAMEDTLTSFQNNLKAETLMTIATAVALIAASAVALSLIDSNKLDQAAGALAAIMASLYGGMVLMSKFGGKGMAAAAASLIAIAVALLIVAGAVAVFSRMDPDELANGLTTAGVAITGLIVAMKALSSGPLSNKVLSAAVAMGIMSVSLIILAGALYLLGKIPYDTLEQGLLAAGAALAGFAIFSRIVKGEKLILAAVGVAAMSAALLVTALAVSKMGAISWEELLRGLVGMAGALLILAGAVKLMSSGLLGAATMAVAAGAVLLIADAMAKLGGMSWDSILRSVVALGASLLILGVAAKLMAGSIAGAAAILVLSIATLVLAEAMTALSAIGWEGILQALVALAGVLAIFAVAGLLLGPVVPVMLGIGAAMLLVGLGAAALGLGLVLAGIGLTALAAGGAAIAGALAGIITVVITLLPAIAIALAEALTGFIITIAQKAPELLEAAVELLLVLIDAIVEVTPAIVEGILVLITTLLETLLDAAPDLIETAFELLMAFLEGIEDNIAEVVETALYIIAEFIKGIGEGLPDVLEAAAQFIIDVIDGMADTVEEYTPQLVESFIGLAGAIITGLINGLFDGIGAVKDALIEIAGAAIDGFMEALGIHSPSKVFTDLTKFITIAIVNTLGRGGAAVKQAAEELGDNAQNGMKAAVNAMNRLLESDVRMSPVITPELDLSYVESGLNSLGSSMRSGSIAAKISSDMTRQSGSNTKESGESSGNGDVTYNQYNYSPKALNTTQIWRETRSHLSRSKDRRLG